MSPSLSYCITNRTFRLPADGWYHVAPMGTYPHPSGVDQVLDDKALAAMVNAFREREKEEGDHFPGLLVDFDHFSNDPKAPSEAAGWIIDLKNRNDGLWAKIDWSDLGEAAVKGGRYRLVSPVWNRGDCESAGPNAIRPLRIDRVAVTNDPNLRGMSPLANRGSSMGARPRAIGSGPRIAATIDRAKRWVPLPKS